MTLKSTTMLVALVLIVSALVAVWIGTRRQRLALSAGTERLIRAGAAHASRSATGDRVQTDLPPPVARYLRLAVPLDRKSTRLNSSHGYISYAVFCLKKKK